MTVGADAQILGERLAAVAALVSAGRPAADIGSDHGRLPRMLIASRRVPRCIASERNRARLVNFATFPSGHRLAGSLEVRVGDGLEVLRPEDGVHTVVLAGMGARTIVEMLARADLQRLRPGRLVLQPQTEPQRVRRWLLTHGHAIADERLALEQGRFYEVVAAEPAADATPLRHPSLSGEDLLVAGPRLVERPDPLLGELWARRLRRLDEIGRSAGSHRPTIAAQIRQARRILDALDA